MPLAEVITLLKQSIGLDVDSVGVESIKRIVSERLRVNELREVSQYANLLRHSGSEMQSLIEAVVIPETFFFRHPESINACQQIIRQALPFSSEKIRVLSIPCSTGEEPYSLAMSLLELGLTPEKFQIDAFDVSERALHVAKAGLFGNHSFRGTGPNFRARYFHETNAGAQLQQRVLDCVRFAQGNVVAENFRAGGDLYHFIFCRNLLIYFDAETQGQALGRLEKLLSPDGLLFVGPAEAGLLTNYGFISARLPMAFAFRRGERTVSPKQNRARFCPRPATIAPGPRPAPAGLGRVAGETPATEKANFVPELEQAGRLADLGRLIEATELCESLLRRAGPSASVYHLLALLRDGAGNREEADRLYRKALYLEPDHYEAAIHLALLNERSGDHAAAKVLRDRARRAQERAR